jgi:hypothetical protein
MLVGQELKKNMGRPPTKIDPKDAARLQAVSKQCDDALRVSEKASARRDAEIVKAIQKGYPILVVAELCNTTRQTVRKALARQGVTIS